MEVTTTPTNPPTNTNSALPPSPEDYLGSGELMEIQFNVKTEHRVRFHHPATGESTRWVEWRTFSIYSHVAWSNSMEFWISNLSDFMHVAEVLGRTPKQKSDGSWELEDVDYWDSEARVNYGDIKIIHIEFGNK